MKIQELNYVDASALFSGTDYGDLFFSSDLPWSFGDNNRTLNTLPEVLDVAEDLVSDSEEHDLEEFKEWRRNLEAGIYLPLWAVYVDLEN